jgi:GNAT superfamily N-acetyltransferase
LGLNVSLAKGGLKAIVLTHTPGADMGASDQIRTATRADERPISALVGLAFATDPYVRWLLPDPYNYLRSNEDYVRQFSGPAFDNGSAFVIGNMCGVALWLGPGVTADIRPGVGANNEFIDPAVLDDLARLIEESSAYRPTEPHWYLKFIAVDPVKRGRGYGAALMAHALNISDRDQRPAYLESTNPANLSLYQRHGFEILAELQVGRSPARYPMLRRPR